MANRFSDTLFQLIHSLEKSEKRHFKLYIKRSSTKEDLKIVQLFDAMDKLADYDEKNLLKKLPARERKVVQLYFIEGRSYEEISTELNIPINNIGVILARARKKLREDSIAPPPRVDPGHFKKE